MPYCAKEDLLTGDIPLAGKYGDGTSFVQLAADEIDSAIGHIYVTPIEFDESTPEATAAARPSKLLLKKINTLLASGRIILDMAAGGEDTALHAYGKSMWKEASDYLELIRSGKIVLVGAPLLPRTESDNTGPVIINEDPYSLVQSFYDNYSTPAWVSPVPVRPYDEVVEP